MEDGCVQVCMYAVCTLYVLCKWVWRWVEVYSERSVWQVVQMATREQGGSVAGEARKVG